MLRAARRAMEAVAPLDFAAFSEDWKAQSIVLHQLMLVGEAVKRLSLDFRTRHSGIPWQAIAGQRHVLIHHYDAVDHEAVWLVVVERLPNLADELDRMLTEETGS